MDTVDLPAPPFSFPTTMICAIERFPLYLPCSGRFATGYGGGGYLQSLVDPFGRLQWHLLQKYGRGLAALRVILTFRRQRWRSERIEFVVCV
ncbi:hypothetical protein [Thalassovita mangrovi]|uniref:hypothetical protein n=1 Tax=Thalassovita mangrovi TaxID=2692236 RepID=UPI001BB2D0FB|nr:hypothetical protein [Thalassovita mangrovi]